MTANPLVSIVTPSHNHAEFLEDAMRSVLEQDYEPIEYLVVDDGSTDGSVEIIERYAPRLAWWARQERRGQAAALNRGFEHATGELLGFVNSDDKLLPGAIATLVGVFGEAQQALLAYGDVVVIDERSSKVGDLRSGPWDPPTMTRTGANPIVQQASLWRREAWEAAGPFDEGSFYWFEFEFWLKLSAHGEGVHLDRPLAAYRLHPRSKTVSALAGRAEDSIRLADGFLAGPDLPAELRPYARMGRASHYWRAGFALYQAGEIRRARRALVHALALDPRVLSPLLLLVLAKSLVPEPIVRRRRAARR